MDAVGLCARCQHVRVIASERGSSFYLCGAARSDPRLRKYPALPVLACLAYAPAAEPGRQDAKRTKE